MVSFFITLFRLIKIIFVGLRTDKDFKFLLYLIIILLLSGTIFYSTVENWSVLNALYFSVMTMSTVGYGDLAPIRDISKVFTILYTFLSIGAFVSFTAKIVQVIISNHENRKEKRNKNSKS